MAREYLKPFEAVAFSTGTILTAPNYPGLSYKCKLTARDPSTNESYTTDATFFYQFDAIKQQYTIDTQAGSLAFLYQQRALRTEGRSLAHEMKHVQSWEMH